MPLHHLTMKILTLVYTTFPQMFKVDTNTFRCADRRELNVCLQLEEELSRPDSLTTGSHHPPNKPTKSLLQLEKTTKGFLSPVAVTFVDGNWPNYDYYCWIRRILAIANLLCMYGANNLLSLSTEPLLSGEYNQRVNTSWGRQAFMGSTAYLVSLSLSLMTMITITKTVSLCCCHMTKALHNDQHNKLFHINMYLTHPNIATLK